MSGFTEQWEHICCACCSLFILGVIIVSKHHGKPNQYSKICTKRMDENRSTWIIIGYSWMSSLPNLLIVTNINGPEDDITNVHVYDKKDSFNNSHHQKLKRIQFTNYNSKWYQNTGCSKASLQYTRKQYWDVTFETLDIQTWAKVDFLVTKTDQTIFLGLFSDQTNTNIWKWKLTISNNNNLYSSLKLQKQYFAKVHIVKPKTHK